jgi:hypothetical protein
MRHALQCIHGLVLTAVTCLNSVQGWGLCFTYSWRTFLHRR